MRERIQIALIENVKKGKMHLTEPLFTPSIPVRFILGLVGKRTFYGPPGNRHLLQLTTPP